MAGRRYTVPWLATGTTTLIALMQIGCGSNKLSRIKAIHVEQSNRYGDAAAQGMRCQVQRATAGGGGGTAITPPPIDPSATAYSGTVAGGKTGTLLTALTSPTVLCEGGMNIQAGWHWTPDDEGAWVIPPGTIYEVTILNSSAVPAASTEFEVTVELEQQG